MALTIIVRSGDVKMPPRITFDSPRVVIGRGGGCEVRLPDPSVSHRHASIRVRGTSYVVLDEGSTNGTFVGATRLEPAAPRVVASGDLIRVGRVWLEVKIEQAMPTSKAGDATKELALALVSEALAAQGEPVAAMVRIVEGPDAGLEVAIAEFERRYVIGRGSDVDLTLVDDDASRRHVEVFRKGSQLSVRDLGSKNGTTVGNLVLKPDTETVWPMAELLIVGRNRLRYTDPVVEALKELENAADEKVGRNEPIEPPHGVDGPKPAEPAPPKAGREGDEERIRAVSAGRDDPVARVPRKAVRTPRRATGWTSTDYLVAVLAILVLASSLVGMWWLFRS